MSDQISTEVYDPDEHDAISGFFSLSYANYLVVNRALLESMPDDWQKIFVGLLRELFEEFSYLPPQPAIDVKILAREPEHFIEREDCPKCEGEGEERDEDGNPLGKPCEDCGGSGFEFEEERIEEPEHVGYIPDPIPHYDRTRTRLPRLSQTEEDLGDRLGGMKMVAEWKAAKAKQQQANAPD